MRLFWLVVGLLVCAVPVAAQEMPSIEEKTDGMERMEGFVPLYWDAQAGTLWMEIPAFEEDLLYVNYLTAGLGSNDVGLDRGQPGDTRVVRFERVGPKVLLVQPNQTYRAHTDNPHERQAVADAFADGVLWGFEAAAQTDDRVLVEATDFVVRDVHGAAQQLEQGGQGSYRLDMSRSTPDLEHTGAFPQNTEMEARLTFVTDGTPGSEVRSTAADPMDIRYNVIQWVHRSTRGWSYGPSITDPRTGEILKGHIVLGSLRVRQDLRIARGLTAPFTGENAAGLPADDNPLLEMALNRIRQLSAHEIGHTLGLRHNFAASTQGRTSVMDYPAPYATLDDDGAVTLDDAYATGMGAWDNTAIRYGYAYPQDGETEDELLARIMQEFDDQDLRYISDNDARPAGAAHPHSNLWDNGSDMVEALTHEMEVRRAALDTFGEAVIRTGEPHALMEEVLVPLYLRHRYQVQATAKLLGGVTYRYSVRGDAEAGAYRVPVGTQRAALDALLEVVQPEALRLPDATRTQIPPRPPGYESNRELFPGRTGLPLDPYAPAEVVATMVFDQMLHPERTARLVQQAPIFNEMLERVTESVWNWSSSREDANNQALRRMVQQVWTDALLEHAAHEDTTPAARALITWQLRKLRVRLDRRIDTSPEHIFGESPTPTAHRAEIRDQIARFLERDYDAETTSSSDLSPPPGSPIGQGAPAYQQRQAERRAWLESVAPEREACSVRW